MRLHRSLALQAGVLGVAAGVVAALGQFLPVILDAPPEQLGPPTFLVGVASLLVSPVLVLALGYRAGSRRTVPREYDSLALSLAVGGAVGYLLGYAVGYLGFTSFEGTRGLALVLLGTTWNALVKAGWFAIAGIAGATVAHFRTGSVQSVQPT